jgi:hypothetical protein
VAAREKRIDKPLTDVSGRARNKDVS